MLNFELLLCIWRGVYLRHVKYLEHRKEIEVNHVYAFENDLSDDEIDIFLLQLDLFEEFEEGRLWNSTLAIPFSS